MKVTRFHKALFAKKRLNYSDQSLTDVALASGSGSIRQFNDTFKVIFGKTPTMVTREAVIK